MLSEKRIDLHFHIMAAFIREWFKLSLSTPSNDNFRAICTTSAHFQCCIVIGSNTIWVFLDLVMFCNNFTSQRMKIYWNFPNNTHDFVKHFEQNEKKIPRFMIISCYYGMSKGDENLFINFEDWDEIIIEIGVKNTEKSHQNQRIF